jgi:hypothetical protein
VYIPVSTYESKTIWNEFLHHIGGQSHVTCAKHDDVPLIVSAVCEHHCGCGAKRYLRCPEVGCSLNLCKKCFKKVKVQNGLSVNPVVYEATVVTEQSGRDGDGNEPYLTKYIADMDKNTRTMFNANIHDPKLIKMETKFLYNTKITSSVIGADKRFERCGTRITLREGSF